MLDFLDSFAHTDRSHQKIAIMSAEDVFEGAIGIGAYAAGTR